MYSSCVWDTLTVSQQKKSLNWHRSVLSHGMLADQQNIALTFTQTNSLATIAPTSSLAVLGFFGLGASPAVSGTTAPLEDFCTASLVKAFKWKAWASVSNHANWRNTLGG